MKKTTQILSTKKLSPEQELAFESADINLVSYSAITIHFSEKKLPKNVQNGIVTSQNGAQVIIAQKIVIEKVFCVGEKTKSLLVQNGYNVVKTAKNASDLAKNIVKIHQKESFLFFCGDKRRNELPSEIIKNNISFQEHICYETHLNSCHFEQQFDGILFFSPSGVQSYLQENRMGDAMAICIGKTTAQEAQKYTKNVLIATQTTVENVISTAIGYFRS